MLLDEVGRVLGAATAEHAPMGSPQIGWAEQDPNDWCGTLRAVRSRMIAFEKAHAQPNEIGGIGLTGQMHGLVLLDADGNDAAPVDHLV